MSKYTIRRDYFSSPWRYIITDNYGHAVALTFTLWGAKRLVRKADNEYRT